MKLQLPSILLLMLFFAITTPVIAQDTLTHAIVADSLLNQTPKDSLSNDTLHQLFSDSLNINSKNDSLTTDSISVNNDTASKRIKEPFEHQFRLMIDISHSIGAIIMPGQYGFETVWDYRIQKDKFLVAELGYGGGKIDYENLKYTSSNAFARVGIDFLMFTPLYDSDWDMITVGARYGLGVGQRSAANFTIPNPFGGLSEGEVPAKNFTAHWFEITAGLRFELLPNFYTGWNVRIRINFSTNIFDGQAAPAYLAGFGQAGSATAFGFNYYVGYALKWHKNKPKGIASIK